ncbi:P-loop containing nucleoside triphosphate hydrolase protein [Daldinia caldariorum]|uniref:P-loop containing nucleoside triphosphate hydrolase protein n=1 Tax=Daldinia caldariorum TaxID=326644 RepID=UPI0020083842|nr:P-loop containing nucleoside triphosphate hydrolase protein [Daldinia caldariorum]KAI1470230.1 P-loop containing nucleoside triphosphate hydrolase protein [Daldinia caldariorum]
MTSMEAESVATIVCTSKQTRFNIGTLNYRELDIEGLNIIVKSAPTPGAKGKAKAKAKGEGTEILSNAKLRIKAGQRYALIGRNGTGKSTLLKAIAEKLIPGIPEETRITILQQTGVEDDNADEGPVPAPSKGEGEGDGLTVLEEVIERATAKQEVQKEINILSNGVDGVDPFGALRAFRKIHHERLQKELFLKDKDARLRSGARGMQARKSLVAMEKKAAEFQREYEQKDEDISPETLADETSRAADMLADLQLQVEPEKLAETESKAKKILAGLGFAEPRMAQRVSSLSGGWKMRTALVAALLQDTDILILDEPTNFLDLLGIIWLQRHLAALAESSAPPTLILVSHDRDFISSACTDLLILKDKDLTAFHGDLPAYESSRAEKKAHLTKMKEAQDRQKEHVQQTIRRNMREGKARDDQNRIRQAKSRQKKLDNRWGLEVGARGGRFKLNRDLAGYHAAARADVEVPRDERRVRLALPEPAELRFPGALISLEKMSFRYAGDGAEGNATTPLVLKDVSLSVGMGDRVGILGLNGSGKSTLVQLLAGEAKAPKGGAVTKHPRLKLGYYAQHAVDTLRKLGQADPELTALGLLMKEASGERQHQQEEQQQQQQEEKGEGEFRALLGSLGLPGRLASSVPLRALSGGQLVRAELARIMARGRPQCLVLDEVTTHLDYETVAALREALRGWTGAVVLVSHDRWFVRGVVEGITEDGEDSEEEGEGERVGVGETRGRRVVYRLKAGVMSVLEGGVGEFEKGVERRVRKMESL